MYRKVVYAPHPPIYITLLAILFTVTILFFFYGFIGYAFRKIGFSTMTVALLLLTTLLGSYINIPLIKIRSQVPIVRVKEVSFFGILIRVPEIDKIESYTTIAINLGGAIIPVLVSIYFMAKDYQILFYGLIGSCIVAFITHLIARPKPGVGIVTPAFIPPLAAALVAIILPTNQQQPIIAYVSGVLGTLIGADITNIRKIGRLGTPYASIGGAGTFDGIFLSGVLAVLLS
ncbi:MAG: DUF1614 domain-containing protein [Nitrososphaeria archaeon]|nr:DUF1614 domain-containing protein [Nitrososphaeria archaeon]